MLHCDRMKIFIDGVLETYTALVLEGYPGQPENKGAPLFTAEDFNAILTRADGHGLQISTHAVGDGGVRRTLDAYEAAQKANDLKAERYEDLEERVGEWLSQDAIVGRVNGRMEYGPRALGNRSVLYPTKDPEVNQWLNNHLGRTEFMPFAPATMASEAHRLIKDMPGAEKAAQFMTLTFDCTDEMKRQCPAAVHVDGTARPQLVSAESNPSFHRILKRYHELTGIAAVMNTSFNMHEEPIVCTPADAIRAFLLGNLNYLAIGPFLVRHPTSDGLSTIRAPIKP
jgi:carbamoyltransferase